MKHRIRMIVSVLPLLAAACLRVGPDYAAPVSEDFPAGFVSAGSDAGAADEPPEVWWESIGDPQLSGLILQAFEANYDLEILSASVRSARALLTETETLRGPDITLTASQERARNSNAAQGNPVDRAPLISPTSLALGATWELDLFGRIERQVEAGLASAEQAEALRDDGRRVLAGDVALAYTDLREAQARLGVAERNSANQGETVRITTVLVEAGRASPLDLELARAQLATTLATIPAFRAGERAALNRLTTLLARAPGELDRELSASAPMPDFPEFVAAGRPEQLLRRRPDIRAAERRLAASTARIGVRTADLFPTVSFGAGISLSATDPGDLGQAGAPGFRLGPSLSWNIFDRQAIYARITQADAAAEADLARYRQTVLLALEETDTAISAFSEEKARRTELENAATASRRAVEIARVRFETGREGFLSVLQAERSLLSAEDDAVASQAATLRALIGIYRATAGGWQSGSQDSPED